MSYWTRIQSKSEPKTLFLTVYLFRIHITLFSELQLLLLHRDNRAMTCIWISDAPSHERFRATLSPSDPLVGVGGGGG